MKYINDKSTKILEKILDNIVPIKGLNIRIIKTKYSKNFIRIEKKSFYKQGHIIILSTIVKNKKDPYYEMPRISVLKLFKDGKYYPMNLVDTKRKWRVTSMEISKNNKKEYKCVDHVFQKILTDYVNLYLEIIENAKILD